MNRYYYLHNGGVWSTLMSEERAKQRNAVKARDDEEALKKLLPSMIAQIYNKMFHDPTLDTYSSIGCSVSFSHSKLRGGRN